MPVTAVGICNSALIKLGAATISSLTQDTKSAVLCNTLYEKLRNEVLRAHPWNFAIMRAQLTPVATAPFFDYTYAFDLPSNCLRVLSLDIIGNEVDYVIEGRQILTNVDSLNVRFIFANDDESSWDPMFAEALAWRLAVELSYSLTQSAPVASAMTTGYKDALKEARSTDGMEGITKPFIATTWTTARR